MTGPAITVQRRGQLRRGADRRLELDRLRLQAGITQAVDNVTGCAARHALKGGIDAQFIADDRVQGGPVPYTFSSIDAYLQAKSGTNPFGYPNLQQVFGNPAVSYNSAFYGLFAQDDWQLTPQIKVLFGFATTSSMSFGASVRANPFSTTSHRQEQLGAARGRVVGSRFLGPTVLRASTGLMSSRRCWTSTTTRF